MHNSKKTSVIRALAVTSIAACSLPASATWSILISDTRTGEVVVGSATCLTGFDLAIETPVVLTGIGAITAQSSVDASGRNRMFVRDRLLEGQPLSSILTELETYDPGHNNRQYGMITTTGDALTYSGPQNADWAGGITGRIEQGRPGPRDDIVYAVQGNILSGSNVVQDAVDAIINTDSDLPGKLMAAMYAARIAGGDGRCSCSNGNPTGCGSPPPAPFKSAHVGYMIGSRADDVDSIRAFYELPDNSTSLTQLDDNSFAVADTSGDIHLFVNATNTNDEVAHFNFQQTLSTGLEDLSTLTAADLDNNGLHDLVVLVGDSSLGLILQSAQGVFNLPIIVPFSEPIADVEPLNIADFAGQQLALTFPTLGSYSIVEFTGGTLQSIQDFISEGDNQSLGVADLNNDTNPDLIVIDRFGQEIRYFYLDSSADVIANFSVNSSPDPVQVRSTDINGDNLLDLLVATDSSQSIDCFINTGTPENPAFAPKISSSLPTGAIDFQITDLNDDGIEDAIVLLESGPNLRYYLGDGTGNFSETNRTRLGGIPTDALIADLNDDGDMDLITNASDQLLIYDNLNNATVQRQTGFARGDKFMFINIANQTSAALDPVDQMLTRFDEFRQSLVGKVDAVQTTVTIPSRVLIDDPRNNAYIRVELRDYESNLLVDELATFELEFDPLNLTPRDVEFVNPGIYNIPISSWSGSGAVEGDYPLRIRATYGGHTVTIMPSPTISTTNSVADFNADGYHDYFDFSLWLRAYLDGDLAADVNFDFVLNTDDFVAFKDAFSQQP